MISHNTTFIKSLQQNYSKFSVAFFNVYYKKKGPANIQYSNKSIKCDKRFLMFHNNSKFQSLT